MALIVGLIDNDEKQTSSKKTLSIPNSTLKCKNHTQFEIKMTKIDALISNFRTIDPPEILN